MFNLAGNKKAIFIILMIMLLTTITCVSAVEDNSKLHKNETVSVTNPTSNNPTEPNSPTYNSISDNPSTDNPITTHTISKEKLNKSVKTEDNDIFVLNQSNINNYKKYEFPDNSYILFEESVENIYIDITHKNITITGNEGVVLKNSHIEVFDGGTLYKISNLTFEVNDSAKYPQTLMLETDNSTIENLVFNEFREAANYRNFYRSINVDGNNNTIINCTFNITSPSKTINWDTYAAECNFETIVIHGDHNKILNNTLTITENINNRDFPFGTIFGISVRGNYNTIDNNDLRMDGTLYLYGIRIYYSNNTVTNNYVEVNSVRYANGIAIESPTSGSTGDNILRNNTVIVTTTDGEVPGEPPMVGLPTNVVYAIMVTEYRYVGAGLYTGEQSNTVNNVIEGNNIYGSSIQAYGVEFFGSKDTVISNNNIAVEGVSAMGIVGGGAGTRISGNIMDVYGQTSEAFPSADWYKPQTSGVSLRQGSDALITGNEITTNHGPAVITEQESGTVISENYIDVQNNDVVVNVKNPEGLVEIVENAITNLADRIITGGEASGNYETTPKEPGEFVIPVRNSTDNQDTDNNDADNNSTDNDNTDTPVSNSTDNNATDTPVSNSTDNNATDTPVSNSTDNNVTDTSDTNNTTNETDNPEPEENKTDVPEPEPEQNVTDVPEPEENKTDVPEPEPEQNQTLPPEPQKDENNTNKPKNDAKTNKTSNNTSSNNTKKQETPVQNSTKVPTNQTIQPIEDNVVNNTQVVNNSEVYINDTTDAGDNQDKNKDKKDKPQQQENDQPQNDPQTNENSNQDNNQDNNQDDEEVTDSAGLTPDESSNAQSENQQDEGKSQSKLGVTATVDNSKIYEVTQKLPEDLMPQHPEVIVVLLIILCGAFTYGYLRKRE